LEFEPLMKLTVTAAGVYAIAPSRSIPTAASISRPSTA